MSDDTTQGPGPDPTEQAAATEAAQHVVDRVTSWEYSADRETIAEKLDDGLAAAGVDLDPVDKEALVDEIDARKGDDTAGTPDVTDARPSN